MMNDIFTNATGSIIAAIVIAILGIGTVSKVQRSGGKAGKNIIIVAWIMIIGGFAHASGNINDHQDLGQAIGFLGLILLPVGSIIAWYQRP